MLCLHMKGIVQANIKRQIPPTSLKDVMLVSTKTVLSNMLPIVNQKGNRSYGIFEMKIAFLVFILFSEVFC